MLDGHEVKFEKSSHVHLAWELSPYIPFKCHLVWMRGDIWKVISCPPHMRTLVCLVMLDGCKVRFEKSSHVHLTWELFPYIPFKCHLTWTRGDIWKVILHQPCVRIFPLYTFQMSPHMDARWHLKSHLTSTLHENFGVVELTLGHTRWMWGEIWKVISHAPWWGWHLVMLDGHEVKFEKSYCMHLVWELWCGGGDTWSH